jgi:hypothetical protein
MGFEPPGSTAGKGFGLGFRGSVELAHDGFIKTADDSVGLGFGFDWIAFPEKDKKTSIFVPLVLQWNFWLSRRWSVFAEPGAGFYLGNATGVRGAIYGGGRLRVTDRLALTLRVGYPTFSAGASYFF